MQVLMGLLYVVLLVDVTFDVDDIVGLKQNQQLVQEVSRSFVGQVWRGIPSWSWSFSPLSVSVRSGAFEAAPGLLCPPAL